LYSVLQTSFGFTDVLEGASQNLTTHSVADLFITTWRQINDVDKLGLLYWSTSVSTDWLDQKWRFKITYRRSQAKTAGHLPVSGRFPDRTFRRWVVSRTRRFPDRTFPQQDVSSTWNDSV